MIRARRTRLAVIFSIVTTIVLVVALINWAYNKEGDATYSALTENYPSFEDENVEFNGIVVEFTASIVNLNGGDTRWHVRFLPLGNYSVERNLLSVPVSFEIDGRKFEFAQDENMNPIDLNVLLYGGDVSFYPFDVHSLDMEIYAEEPSANGNSSNATPVPIALSFISPLNTVAFSGDISTVVEGNNPFIFSLTATVSRTVGIRAFTVFIALIMWILSLLTVAIAVVFIVYLERAPEAPMLAAFGAILFALPALRNSLPTAPGIGCALDVASFFFNMLFVALSTITLLILYVTRQGLTTGKKDLEKKEEADKRPFEIAMNKPDETAVAVSNVNGSEMAEGAAKTRS